MKSLLVGINLSDGCNLGQQRSQQVLAQACGNVLLLLYLPEDSLLLLMRLSAFVQRHQTPYIQPASDHSLHMSATVPEACTPVDCDERST